MVARVTYDGRYSVVCSSWTLLSVLGGGGVGGWCMQIAIVCRFGGGVVRGLIALDSAVVCALLFVGRLVYSTVSLQFANGSNKTIIDKSISLET